MASFLLRRSLVLAHSSSRVASRHMCAASKTSTGLVGLEVDPDYKNTLTTVYEDTLRVVEGIPEGAPYRGHVEKLTKHRLQIVQDAETAEAIEEAIGLGQVEEIAAIARDQLEYLPSYIENRLWETVDERNARLGL